MGKAILLSIHSIDVAGAILTVVWLLAIVIVMLLDYGFKHGLLIPSDETVCKYREKYLSRKQLAKDSRCNALDHAADS
jgi:hypothetical protein